MKNTLGTRIKRRREELGLTQTELAERLGLKSKVSVSNAENDRDDMTTTRIQKYAEALNTSIAYLMGWTEIEYSPKQRQQEILNTKIIRYGVSGIKIAEILDILDNLPPDNNGYPKGLDEIHDFSKYIAQKYDVQDLLTKAQFDQLFMQYEIDKAKRGE